MTHQPEAIALADFLVSKYDLYPNSEQMQAAALLRAQHAEIEADNRNLGILTDALAQCSKARADLEAENKRLREALSYAVAFKEGGSALAREALKETP